MQLPPILETEKQDFVDNFNNLVWLIIYDNTLNLQPVLERIPFSHYGYYLFFSICE